MLGNETGLHGEGLGGFGDEFEIGDVDDPFEDGELPPMSELEEAKVPDNDVDCPAQVAVKGLQEIGRSNRQEEKAAMTSDPEGKEAKEDGTVDQA